MNSAEINSEELDGLFREYLPKIVNLAKKNISPKYQRNFDADDIGGTVLRTVSRRMANGSFQFENEESLWKQLVAITLRRISNKIRSENAEKRGGGKNPISISDLEAAAKSPDPSHAVEFGEVLVRLGEQLDPVAKRVLELRLEGRSYSEIAIDLNVAERTVGRKIQLIKELLGKNFDLDDPT